MDNKTLQIQSVLYNNDIDSIARAIESLYNAICVYNSSDNSFNKVTLVYGDASVCPLFTQNDILKLNERYSDKLTIEYRFFNENTGTAKGHNALGKDCDSLYMMVMNPDVLVSPRFFNETIKLLDDESLNIGLVEARQTPIEHPKKYDERTGDTAWAATACVIFPTEIFKQINGFDEESFFMYCDDVDFSWRIRLYGKRVVYCPKAFVFHAKRISNQGNWIATSAERYYSAEAALILSYKWSREDITDMILEIYRNSDDPDHVKAVKTFLSRKEVKNLPVQIDTDHKIATFINGNYAEHRYLL